MDQAPTLTLSRYADDWGALWQVLWQLHMVGAAVQTIVFLALLVGLLVALRDRAAARAKGA